MKKIISVAVALCIAITSLFTSVYAMADSKVTSGDIKKKLNDTAIYLLSEKKADFGAKEAKDLVAYINAGIDVNDYKDEFVSSVNTNLAANDGKILTAVKTDFDENYKPIKIYNEESAGVYANVITALDYFGFDVKNYEGVNLVENFKNVELNKDYENPYLFSSIFAVAEKYGLADTLKAAQNFLLNNFYEFGTGSTYYTSTDSDAQLVVALAPYSNKYKSFIDDTLNCMESYKADGGYLYNLDKVYNYNTGELEDPVISGNSTGLALAAYSAMNDFDKAQKIYNEIVNSFECKDVKGAYAYTAGGDENALATADVFTGLTKFYEALKIKETKDALTTTTTTAPANNITTTTTTSTSQAAVAKIKAPKKTSIKKVKGAKKAISVTWKKVSGVKGYQVQVATNKKFKKNKKTVTIKKQKTTKTTVKKLKAKKKYYVRIRTYKIANGKKVYSSWSKVKSVKTK